MDALDNFYIYSRDSLVCSDCIHRNVTKRCGMRKQRKKTNKFRSLIWTRNWHDFMFTVSIVECLNAFQQNLVFCKLLVITLIFSLYFSRSLSLCCWLVVSFINLFTLSFCLPIYTCTNARNSSNNNRTNKMTFILISLLWYQTW